MNEDLIKNSVSFKSLKISHTSKPYLAYAHEGRQPPWELFIYLFILYYIIYFRLVVYIVTCTVYIYEHEAIRIPKSENNIGAPLAPQKLNEFWPIM